MATSISTAGLAHWMPYQLFLGESRQFAAWLRMAKYPLREPFFAASVAAFKERHPRAKQIVTELDALARPEFCATALAPKGFIFHMSRCGSTALSRALAASRHLVVLSEAEPVNQVIGAEGELFSKAQRESWLGMLLTVLGRRRTGAEQGYVVKFSSWNALYLAEIRRLFPRVPWVFIYREPVEVLVSLLAEPPGWLLARHGPWARSIGKDMAANLPVEEFGAVIIGEVCRRALLEADRHAVFLTARDLPLALATVLDHFQIVISDTDRAALYGESMLYSKSRTMEIYRDDSAAKRAQASPSLRAVADSWLGAVYQALENQARHSERFRSARRSEMGGT